MRLIDADALLNAIDKRYQEKEGVVPDNLAEGFMQMEKLIKEQPTAYDVEKVVEQIHGYFKSVIDKSDSENAPLEVLDYNKAICDIVRGGRE